MSAAADVVALVRGPGGDGMRAALVGGGVAYAGPAADVLDRVEALERARRPRWVWWDAGHDARMAVARGVSLGRCWDLAEAHRLLHGGWAAAPGLVWAAARGLSTTTLPRRTAGDLFDFVERVGPPTGERPPEVGDLVRADGHLRPDLDDRAALSGPAADSLLLAWGSAALLCAAAQHACLAALSPRAVTTAQSESAAALLCVELEECGLPVDRQSALRLIEASAGPRPTSDEDARALLAERDSMVLRHLRQPPDSSTDLRSPAYVKAMLASAGIALKDTRAWRLEPFRESSPLVEALLQWRKAERIATTYGYAWLDAHVGPDDRLRGEWTACDGAAGRMTASNGLHNLPRPLRPAIAAASGHVLVRADLGQVEPRVLAAVSGDRAFARDTAADDLYAPVAARLGVDRPRAKIAVLAAMYGQTSGAAGEALKGLQRAYPQAVAYLEAAYADGVAGTAVRTFGGRRVPMGAAGSAGQLADIAGAGEPAALDGALAGRGRFARNAVVQGAAAELFKAWAATVRLMGASLDAQIVLCLHDELLVHVPVGKAQEAASMVDGALADAARRWVGGAEVRFVSDTRILRRWSEAKD